MRLLYLCSDFGVDPRGVKGASIHLRSITRALCELGHEVAMLSPKGDAGADHPARALHAHGAGPAAEVGRRLKDWLSRHELHDGAARELRPLIYNTWACEPALTALRERPVEAIVERLSLFGHVGVDLSDALDVPLIVEMNAPLAAEAEAYRALQLRDLAREIERRVLHRAEAIAVVSEALATRLVALGIPSEKVHVVPNGAEFGNFLDVPQRALCRKRFDLDGAFVVGFVGSFKPWHGAETLLRAFVQLCREDPKARLLMVGDGPGALGLQQLAMKLELADRVVFTGALPHEEIPGVLRAMDVAVAPFADVPGFYFSPIKLFEYMAAGVCVVASRLGQIAEIVEDGVNGLLCEPDDSESLLGKLRQARESEELRSRLGAAAAGTIRDRYTWSHTARRLSEVIERAVARRRAGSRAEAVGTATV